MNLTELIIHVGIQFKEYSHQAIAATNGVERAEVIEGTGIGITPPVGQLSGPKKTM